MSAPFVYSDTLYWNTTIGCTTSKPIELENQIQKANLIIPDFVEIDSPSFVSVWTPPLVPLNALLSFPISAANTVKIHPISAVVNPTTFTLEPAVSPDFKVLLYNRVVQDPLTMTFHPVRAFDFTNLTFASVKPIPENYSFTNVTFVLRIAPQCGSNLLGTAVMDFSSSVVGTTVSPIGYLYSNTTPTVPATGLTGTPIYYSEYASLVSPTTSHVLLTQTILPNDIIEISITSPLGKTTLSTIAGKYIWIGLPSATGTLVSYTF